MRDVTRAELRCRRCAKQFSEATFLGHAIYPYPWDEETEVLAVDSFRRVGKGEMARIRASDVRLGYPPGFDGEADRRWVEREAVTSKDRDAMKLPCRRCKAKPDVAFARLFPLLEAGFQEIHIDPGGDVYPVGVSKRLRS